METHIIGGAIIPLWQRLKTNEDARLRVVRVTTEEGQRIVGIQIPPDNVGTVLRSLGLSRDLREPEEIFYAVLDEGEEMTLASNLKLRRGSIHSEPAIELCGADPYKFAELRELGLLNEQISWKQRFFVPTDETTGVEILSALLDRYPVVVAHEAASEPNAGIIEASPKMKPTNIIDLGQWIVAAAEGDCAEETANEIDLQLEGESLALETEAEEVPLHESKKPVILNRTPKDVPMPWLEQPNSATQLALEFA